MNFIRKSLVFLLLFLLVGCSTNLGDEKEDDVNTNEKVHLNIQQADLIASFTDNEKYLNKNLLNKIDILEDDDLVNVIISLKSTGLVDRFNENNKGYLTLSEYANSRVAAKSIEQMSLDQNQVMNALLEGNYVNSIKHSYTTLLNGFSATTTYGQLKKLQKAGFDIDITISEVYSEPEYKTLSTDKVESGTVTNFVNVYETGIFNSSGVGYDGNNTSVAILDSGFDVHHTVFQNMPDKPMFTINDIESILYETKAYGYANNIKAQDVYLNAKIPFAYDYADKDADVAPYDSDHGTHVAGIIGGKDDVITGVAVNTQLVLMKVFGDINNGAIQDDILAALEDAILLGVDAINLSLGTACGFSRSSDNEYINVVYDKIEAAGISLLVAASNDYSSGYGGENSNTNKASNPDSATVGSPGTFKSTMSVASISGVKSSYIIDETGYTFFFNNANNNAGKAYDFYKMLYEELDTGDATMEIEYVTVPGVGKKVNYSSIDVKGKIALVKRGETSFEEKAQVALSQGAIGCIIYNNIAGEVYMNAGSGLAIPLCSINKDDGEYLAAKGTGVLTLDKNYLAGPFMSDFSSWGPVSDLALKPEITAHGGSILSSVPGGGYDEISGTSMACPNLCGVMVLMRQALKEKYPTLTAPEINNLANQLVMSTGTIILDEYGNPYSPRKQGAGLGNLEYALETLAYLSVDNSTKAKIECKDDPKETGIYELKFNVNNTSNKELKYAINDLTMTESLSTADPAYVAEKAYMLNPNVKIEINGEGTLSGNELTVDANGKVEITYTISLTDAEKKYIRESFINGIYVEGFVVLESQNEDEIDLSIPFLAFFGDWTKAPLFDKTYFEVESEAHDGSIDDEDKLKADYYATTPLGTYYYSYIIPLGTYVYEIDESKYDPIPATEDKAAIGYTLETINGITTVYAGLLRNAKKMTTVIKNASTGEVVYEHLKYDEHKAYFGGQVIPGYDMINITALELGLQNNTKYTFTMTAELDYGDGGLSTNLNNTFEFSFYVDYESPIIKDVEFYSKYDKSLKDYRYYCDVYVYDNHYAQSIRPFTISQGKLVSLSDNVIPIYGERGQVNKVNIEITDYMDLLRYGEIESGEFPMTNGLGFLVDDYALNQSYSFVTLPGTNSSDIAYKEEFYSSKNNNTYQFYKDIYVGDELDLTKMMTSTDPQMGENEDVQSIYFSKLNWTSSDENVIKVKDGKIEAMSSGTCMITCTTLDQAGYKYEINLRIRVRDKNVSSSTGKLTDIEFTYFDTIKAFIDGNETSDIGETGDRFFFTDKPNLSMFPSEQVKLGFEMEPWNLKDYKLIWSSTNEKVATVNDEGVVTALKEGNATITLKVEIDGRVSSLVASKRVIVKNEFVIEGQTLVAYKGLGGDVVIPDDKGILYIGPFAFSLYTNDYTIELPEGDYDAGKTPASNNTVTSVTIPYDVLEVQKYAFYNCTALETVNFLSNDKNESCKFIREYAFSKATSLKNINLENVGMIGNNAFEDCTSLNNVDLRGAYAIGRRAFYNCTSLEYVDITALRNAGVETFMNCTSLKTIDNGRYTNFSVRMFRNSGLTTLTYFADRIPDNCFENCKDLTNVEIVNNLVYVGAKAFNNCGKLEKVVFSENAGSEFIYEKAFNNCTALEEVTLPNSATHYEKEAFNNCANLTKVLFQANSYISVNDGSIFTGCSNLTTFTVDENNKNYKVNNNLLTSLDGLTIYLAANGYNYNEYIIPEGYEYIAEGAFSGISSLTKLTISDDVKVIGKRAFENCKNLTDVVLPNKEIEILSYAFNNCSSLENINLENLKTFNEYVLSNTAIKELNINATSIKEGAFANMKELTTLNVSVNELAPYAFRNNTKLVNAIVNAKTIGEYAFENCTSLNNLTLENTIDILEGAFKNCTGLVNVLSNTVKNIADYAFTGCKNIETISFDNVENIGNYAFGTLDTQAANKLTEINFGDNLTSIGEYAFYGSTLVTNIKLGKGLLSIGAFAFSNLTSLETVTINSDLETISECLFANDALLKEANISGIKVVEGGAFMNCSLLETIDLKDATIIGMEAFSGCLGLTSVDLSSVKVLEAGAFLTCNNLTNVTLKVVERIETQALSCIGVTEIKLPATIEYIAPTAFYYNVNMTKFTDLFGVDTCDVNDYVKLDNGVLYTVTANNKLLLTSYPTNKDLETYEVLFNTVRIDEYAGYFNKSLETLIFPDTLEFIGNYAFYGCTRLKNVEFKSVKAPTLEGTVTDLGIEYEPDSEIYQLLNKYFQFNGYYPLYYAQFIDLLGKTKKLNIVIPANEDVSGYDNILYQLYFDLDNKTVSDYVALDTYSIDYLNKVAMIPNEIKLSDEVIIQNARTAYNVVTQDLTKYGYSKEYLDGLYEKLVNAENTWKLLNDERITHVYEFLINDIENLGSKFEFTKINDYYSIVKRLDIVNRHDLKYIDQSNVESFKKEFDKYFKDLNEDVNILTDISTLPTTSVNKVGLIVVSSMITTIGIGAVVFTILKRKIYR